MTPFFLHGIGAGAESYDWLAPLVPGGIALNLPGFGDEPWTGPASFPALADWLAARIDAAGAGPVALFGHSFGGMLALETALRHPDRVRALILCASTPAFGGRDPAFAEQFLAARLGPLDRGATMADLARQGAREMAAEGADPERLDRFAASMARVPEHVYRDIVRCLTTFDRREDLARVTQPTLVLAGTADQVAPARTVAKMAERIPGAAYRDYACGHLAPLEAPEAIAADVRAFLGSLDAAA